MEIAEAVDRRIRRAVEQRDFSGVVHLRRGAEVLCARAYGAAQRAEGILNRVDTRFGIASGTKSFTAVAVIRLIERGRLGLESRLRDLLGSAVAPLDRRVTVGQLLTHSSGVADYADENVPGFDYESLWRERPVYRMRTLGDWMPLLQGGMKFAPGERFEYCNSGYILLGLVIETVAGEDFCTHVQREVFDPAGMRASGFFEADRLPAGTALGYIPLPEEGGHRTNVFSIPARGGPDGGAYATAPDLARFIDALRSHHLAGEGMTRELLRPHIRIDETGRGYGYGFWFGRTAQGGVRMSMIGSDPGAECSSSFYPERDLQLTLLTNLDGGLGDLRGEIEELLFG